MTGSRRFRPVRDLPAVLWLVALLAVALVHPFVPAPRWLMLHLLLLGAVTHSILVWSRHFADALLHTAATGRDRALETARLVLHNAGALGVVAGGLAGRWPVTAVGAAGVAAAVGWHAVTLLRQMRRALPSRFGATVRYYVLAASLLPVGALLGVLMARGLGAPRHEQVVVAHVVVNVLGWVGLTVLGTLVTLWPTMLRTRVDEGAETAGRAALPVLGGAVVVTATAALLGSRAGVAAGLAGYLLGVGILAPPFARAARSRAPRSFPAWSVLAGLSWLVGSLTTLTALVARASDWEAVGAALHWAAVPLAAGFAAQVLLGALSYLVPVVLGGGPTPVRTANAVLDRGGPMRVALVNAGLLVCVLPVPSLVRVLASVLVLGGLASFVPLLLLAIRASRRARSARAPQPPTSGGPARRRGPAAAAAERPAGQVTGLAAAGLAAVVLAAAIGVALDPAALAGNGAAASASAGVTATGRTTTVVVEAADMRFTPSTVEVPAGDRLVIDLRNTDDHEVHDLVLDSGDGSGRLSPGESTRLDVGVVGRDLQGWCSVVGHRQMGMVLHVRVTGAAPTDGHAGHDERTGHDLMADPGAGFRAHDPVLPALGPGRVHRRTLTVREVDREVAPGVVQRLWTYDGTAPGPLLHGRVGDRFVIRLVNDGTIGHSVDFHAGALAPDRPMRTIAPGESLVYRFTATRAGIWMYHCSTMPMSAHIANGLYGAVVIEPPGLSEVDRSYVLVQSELYLGGPGEPVDVDKVLAERPDLVAFNGYANQYDHAPLAARLGERVRVWVLDAGPNRSTSFHVVGAQFDTVYSEGAFLLRRGQGGAQALALAPAQGGFVELAFPEPGRYPFVSHVMVDAERGAHGAFEVTR